MRGATGDMAPKKEMSAKEIGQFVKKRMASLSLDERALLTEELKRGAQKRKRDKMKVLGNLVCSNNLSVDRKGKLIAEIRALEAEELRMEEEAARLTPKFQVNLVEPKEPPMT